MSLHGRCICWQDKEQLGRATEVAKYIIAEGTGYSHQLALNLEPEGTQRFLELTVAPVGKRIVISFYNKVAQDRKQDCSYIQMRLPDPHSAVTSQQQLDRATGTAQRIMEVELEETEMWLARALCELDIECPVSSYNPSCTSQALKRLVIQPKMKREMKDVMRKMLGRMR